MPSAWRRCDTCRRVLAIDNYPSHDDEATTCSECLAPKPARARRATTAVTTRRATSGTSAPRKVAAAEPAPPPEPVPLRQMVGRGEPAARRARARAIALEDLRDEHATEYQQLLAAAAEERRGPGRASTELVERHREEFEERLASAHEAEGLPRSTFG
jgi:hypothetical protein